MVATCPSLSDSATQSTLKAATTPLTVLIELPGIGFKAALCIDVKQEGQTRAANAVEEVVHTVCQKIRRDFTADSGDVVVEKLEMIRKDAIRDLTEWQNMLRLIDDWREKSERASSELCRMREAYFKEIYHLREQLYRQGRRDESLALEPAECAHFDALEFLHEDDIARIVGNKVKLAKEEWDEQFHEMMEDHKVCNCALREELVSTKVQLLQRNQLVEAIVRQRGYKNEQELLLVVGSIAPSDLRKAVECCDQEATVLEQNAQHERRLEQEVLSRRLVDGQSTESMPPSNNPSISETEVFCRFLTKRFGSARKATSELSKRWPLTQPLSLNDFTALTAHVGYSCNLRMAFIDLSKTNPRGLVLASVLGVSLGPQQISIPHEERSNEAEALGCRGGFLGQSVLKDNHGDEDDIDGSDDSDSSDKGAQPTEPVTQIDRLVRRASNMFMTVSRRQSSSIALRQDAATMTIIDEDLAKATDMEEGGVVECNRELEGLRRHRMRDQGCDAMPVFASVTKDQGTDPMDQTMHPSEPLQFEGTADVEQGVEPLTSALRNALVDFETPSRSVSLVRAPSPATPAASRTTWTEGSPEDQRLDEAFFEHLLSMKSDADVGQVGTLALEEKNHEEDMATIDAIGERLAATAPNAKRTDHAREEAFGPFPLPCLQRETEAGLTPAPPTVRREDKYERPLPLLCRRTLIDSASVPTPPKLNEGVTETVEGSSRMMSNPEGLARAKESPHFAHCVEVAEQKEHSVLEEVKTEFACGLASKPRSRLIIPPIARGKSSIRASSSVAVVHTAGVVAGSSEGNAMTISGVGTSPSSHRRPSIGEEVPALAADNCEGRPSSSQRNFMSHGAIGSSTLITAVDGSVGGAIGGLGQLVGPWCNGCNGTSLVVSKLPAGTTPAANSFRVTSVPPTSKAQVGLEASFVVTAAGPVSSDVAVDSLVGCGSEACQNGERRLRNPSRNAFHARLTSQASSARRYRRPST
eukprot:TRINITY_DN37672_c0_g1_i1.p1 TRINITY_DN37672_c0_g1~~TRINITY_DN37672_c0_g1_i1.p1  ORF type:complete len:984 (+),score=163.99 TRINITY_DN37672_c0_g1_i1:232-3183(+)